MSGIFLIQEKGDLVEMQEAPYDTEAVLQELLAKYPKLLAGDQMDSQTPRRWLLITREMGVPCEEDGPDRWSLDHLFLDQDAVPTLIEVKRSSDRRIRRAVVGQMLDYAANAVVYWPVETMRAKFEQRPGSVKEMEAFLGEGNVEEFWQRAKTNLQAGRIRMVFVADEIPPELRRVVEFLNGQMDPAEVLAVEVKQFVGQGLKTLVPRVIGQTTEAERKKSAGGKGAKWTTWDAALAGIKNPAIIALFHEEIKAKREDHLPKRKIFYRVANTRRWMIRATPDSGYVRQLGRFNGDIEFWKGGLSQKDEVKPVANGEVLRFYLDTDADIQFFRQAVKGKAGVAWTTTPADDEGDGEAGD